jgi:hypothetical protein
VATRPGDARILVDDKIVGVGTFSDRLPIGTHMVSVEAEGRPTEKRTVVLDADGDMPLSVIMRPARPKNGKIELLIGSSAFGLVEGGLLGTALTDDKTAITGLSAAFGAAGFFIPYFALPAEVPVGQSSALVGGRLWGMLEGATIAGTLFPAQAFEERADDTRFLIVGGSIAVSIGAGMVAHWIDLSAGDAAIVNSSAIWGTTAGVLAFLSFASSDSNAGGPIAFASLNLGLIAGGVISSYSEISRGHVFLIDLAGFAGLVSGTALSAILQDNDATPRFALGGLVSGLVVGTIVTRSVDADTSLLPTASIAVDMSGAKVPVLGFQTSW